MFYDTKLITGRPLGRAIMSLSVWNGG